jgi:hypothetical protein
MTPLPRRQHFLGRRTRVLPSRCLNCDKLLDATTGVDHRQAPRPGNYTICISCGHLMAFADDLSLRNLTDAEMIDIAGDPAVLAIMHARAGGK